MGIKSGGRTRLVSIIHALILLAARYLFRVPMAGDIGLLLARRRKPRRE